MDLKWVGVQRVRKEKRKSRPKKHKEKGKEIRAEVQMIPSWLQWVTSDSVMVTEFDTDEQS